MRERRGIEAKAVEPGFDADGVGPGAVEGISRRGGNRVHPVLEKTVLDFARRRGGKIEVPGAEEMMELGRPDQFAERTGAGFVPHINRRCLREPGNRPRPAQLNAVVGGNRGGEIIPAVGVPSDAGIGALEDERGKRFHAEFRGEGWMRNIFRPVQASAPACGMRSCIMVL